MPSVGRAREQSRPTAHNPHCSLPALRRDLQPTGAGFGEKRAGREGLQGTRLRGPGRGRSSAYGGVAVWRCGGGSLDGQRAGRAGRSAAQAGGSSGPGRAAPPPERGVVTPSGGGGAPTARRWGPGKAGRGAGALLGVEVRRVGVVRVQRQVFVLGWAWAEDWGERGFRFGGGMGVCMPPPRSLGVYDVGVTTVHAIF